MSIHTVTSGEEMAATVQYYDHVVIEVWSENDPDCKVMAPVFGCLSKDFHNIYFVRVNHDEHPDIIYGAKVLPHYAFFLKASNIINLAGTQDVLQSEVVRFSQL